MEFYSLACQSGQFTSKLPTVWIQIPSLILLDGVLLEEEKLCWWDLTMVEILWKPRESYVKLFATGIKARFTTFFWQETSSGFSILLPGHIMGVMHSFCAEGDESSHEGRAFRWRGFADSNLWSRSDYQWLIHNQSIRWPQWSWSPHAQPPVVIAILPYPLVGSAKKITTLVAGANKFST